MKRQPSITLRLSLLFALASSFILIGVGGFVGWATDRHFEDIDAAEIDGKLELIGHAIADTRDAAALNTLPHRLGDALVGHHALSVSVSMADGKPIIATGSARFPPSVMAEPLNGGRITRALLRAWDGPDGSPGDSYRGVAVTLPSATPGGAPFRVALAVNISHHQIFSHEIRRTIWIAIGCGIFMISILAWFMAHRGLAPLRDIVQLARDMSAEHLNARLPFESVPVELNDLAHSFNDMLSRLEDSFRRLSDFSSDIAHELRTPIGNLMMQTQVALSKARNAEEYREILYSNLEEYQRLAAMIADMLFLAKADNGLIMPSREPVDLRQEIDGLFTFYEALAEDQGIGLAARGNAMVLGDRLMLRRALSNLLSNAIRHTPRGGTVSVGIKRTGESEVLVTMENPGEPIPAQQLPRIFDRFYRVDPSRQRTSEGAGLGLAITRSIVLSHGGQIRVSSGQTTRFEIQLPGLPLTSGPAPR